MRSNTERDHQSAFTFHRHRARPDLGRLTPRLPRVLWSSAMDSVTFACMLVNVVGFRLLVYCYGSHAECVYNFTVSLGMTFAACYPTCPAACGNMAILHEARPSHGIGAKSTGWVGRIQIALPVVDIVRRIQKSCFSARNPNSQTY